MFQVLCLKCVALSGSSMILVGIFLRYYDLFLKFLLGTSLWCGLSDMCSAKADVIAFLSFTTFFLCFFNLCPKVHPVWPIYVCGHGMGYTTPALSSLGMGSLG